MELKDHPALKIVDLLQLRTFMEAHVFCVWDFMLLAKRLQSDLTSVHDQGLWRPKSVTGDRQTDARLRRVINQILLDEESDIAGGKYLSHFELYLNAMLEVGADTSLAEEVVYGDHSSARIQILLDEANSPARGHVMTNINMVTCGSTAMVYGAFLYGRENLIPQMFQSIIDSLDLKAPMFRLYLEHHIEMDGDSHGPELEWGVRFFDQRDVKLGATVALEERRNLFDKLVG